MNPDKGSKPNTSDANTASAEPVGKEKQEAFIDDLSYVRELKHSRSGFFERYDVLLDTRIYGWETILRWADYMSAADFDRITAVTVADVGGSEIELTDAYKASGKDILHFDELSRERGMLSVAGSSRALKDAVKIVWLNQTRVLRLFCMTTDEATVRKYLETMCRRNFGTEDEMKPARPHDEIQTVEVPEQEPQPVKVPEQMSQPVKVPEQMSRPVKVPEQMSRPVKVPEQMSQPVKVPEQMSRPVKVPEQMSRPVKVPEQMLRPVKVPEQMSQPVKVPKQMSQPVKVPEQMSRPVEAPKKETPPPVKRETAEKIKVPTKRLKPKAKAAKKQKAAPSQQADRDAGKAKRKKRAKDAPMGVFVAGMALCFVAILLNAINCEQEFGFVGLAVFHIAAFVVGMLMLMVCILIEQQESGVLFRLSAVFFALGATGVHVLFGLLSVDVDSKVLLAILITSGTLILLGALFRIRNRSKTQSVSAIKVIREDAKTVREIILPLSANRCYNASYRYNNRIIRVNRDRAIQRFPEKSVEITKVGNTEFLYSWAVIWLCMIIGLQFPSALALIVRMVKRADTDRKKAGKKLVAYLLYSLALSALMAFAFFSMEFSFAAIAAMLIISPALNFFVALYFLLFDPAREKVRYGVRERVRDLVRTEKITDINAVAEHAGISYAKTLDILEGLIEDGGIAEAFIDYSAEEIFVKGITDRVARKCVHCGGTSVFNLNDDQKCRWCGAEYE